jgi:hypothetical protein
VLVERILVIYRVLAARAAARLLVQGTLVPMTRFEFLDRFTPQERIAVRERAKTDPMVYDFMDLLYQSGNVTHAKARQGLAYLGSIGVLPADRVASIGAE